MAGWLGTQHVQGNTLTLNQHSDKEHAPEPSIVSPAGPTPAADSASERADPIEACLVWVLEHIGRPMSRAALRARTAREPRPWVIEVAVEALESLGVRCAPYQGRRLADLDALALVATVDCSAMVLTGGRRGGEALVYIPEEQSVRTVTDAWLREVSVGEALALTKDPPLLLLDEPASAMDTAAERAFIDRLKAAYAGRSIILITHRASLLELVDRVLVADGPKDKVLAPVINRTATVAKA